MRRLPMTIVGIQGNFCPSEAEFGIRLRINSFAFDFVSILFQTATIWDPIGVLYGEAIAQRIKRILEING